MNKLTSLETRLNIKELSSQGISSPEIAKRLLKHITEFKGSLKVRKAAFVENPKPLTIEK